MHTIAFLNGQFIDSDQVLIPPHDAGFLMGVTIAEQLRTFGGNPFWLKDHLQRLYDGLRLAGIEPPIDRATLHAAIHTVVAHNHPLQTRDGRTALSDIGVTVFVTPGAYASYGVANNGPMLAVHTYPLQFQLWANKYENGQNAIVSEIRQVSNDCWPAAIKCRSRMHYFLATKKAREVDSTTIPILLDHDEFISETPIASVVAYQKETGFLAPSATKVLPGISLAYLRQLAARLQIPFRHADITVGDLLAADEILLASTPFAALPLVRIDGGPIGDGLPGPMYSRVLDAWSSDVGVDIQAQAETFA